MQFKSCGGGEVAWVYCPCNSIHFGNNLSFIPEDNLFLQCQLFPSSFIKILFWLFGDGFQLIMHIKRGSLSCWVSKFLASPHWCTHWSVLTLVPTLLTLSSAHTAVRCCILVPTFLNISLSTALLLSWQTTTAVSLDLRWLYYFILYTALSL